MATGSMAVSGKLRNVRHFTVIAVLLGGVCGLAVAQEVGLAGIMGSKAMLLINGGEPQALRVGESAAGVKLLALQGESVVVEINGRKRSLRVGQNANGVGGGDGSGKVTLTADERGHFMTLGTVNGGSLRFLVDTGASLISLGASDARRLGLDFNRGQRAVSNTANGQVEISRVTLDTVRIGDITVHGVEAAIHRNEMPYALLGMSFLNRMEMQRDGTTMTLKKRF